MPACPSGQGLSRLITTPGGQRIAVRAEGYGQMPGALPPLEAFNAPAFQWPDMPIPIIGVAFFQTVAPDLAWINRTPLAFTGTVNPGSGRLQVSIRALTPELILGGPTP